MRMLCHSCHVRNEAETVMIHVLPRITLRPLPWRFPKFQVYQMSVKNSWLTLLWGWFWGEGRLAWSQQLMGTVWAELPANFCRNGVNWLCVMGYFVDSSRLQMTGVIQFNCWFLTFYETRCRLISMRVCWVVNWRSTRPWLVCRSGFTGLAITVMLETDVVIVHYMLHARTQQRASLRSVKTWYPLQLVVMDILWSFPESESGNKYILIIPDCLTKWTEAYSIPDGEASTMAKKFTDKFFFRNSRAEFRVSRNC